MDEPSYSGRAAGGRARARSLSAERKSEIGKKAAAARWEQVPEVTAGAPDRPLVIGDITIECYVLEDGTRVITQRSFLTALGRSRTARRTEAESSLPIIVQGQALRPFIPDGFEDRAAPIPFRHPNGGKALGYNAEVLPDVCDVYLRAREAKVLPRNQWHIAQQAEILVRGLARVGIVALVDEATGYQDMRTKNALAKILEQFVDRELQIYLKTFPDEFYKEMFRLRGLPYTASVKRPQYFGLLTNDIVYKRLAPGVLEELKRVQERGTTAKPKHQLFRRLTHNVGYPKLREHLGSVTTLMKISDDWDEFKHRLDRIHPRIGDDVPLDFDVDFKKA